MPAGRAVVERVATPLLFRVPVPRVVVPVTKVTVPVAAPVVTEEETVAVSNTLAP